MTSLPNICYGLAALIYLKAPQWQEGCAGPIQYKSVLMGRSRNSSRVPELTTTCRTSFPEDHRVEESSSLRNYHPGFATGVVIPANFEEYQRKSDRIGEVIFSSAGNRCLNSDCIYPTGEDIKKALKKAAEPGGRLLLMRRTTSTSKARRERT